MVTVFYKYVVPEKNSFPPTEGIVGWTLHDPSGNSNLVSCFLKAFQPPTFPPNSSYLPMKTKGGEGGYGCSDSCIIHPKKNSRKLL